MKKGACVENKNAVAGSLFERGMTATSNPDFGMLLMEGIGAKTERPFEPYPHLLFHTNGVPWTLIVLLPMSSARPKGIVDSQAYLYCLLEADTYV